MPRLSARLHRGGRRVSGAIRWRADTGPSAPLPAAETLLSGDRGGVSPAAVRHGEALLRLGAVRQ